MRSIKQSPKKQTTPPNPTQSIQPQTTQYSTKEVSQKITFACDAYLLQKIKNALQSQHLAGNYQHPNLSQVLRQALQAYQQGLPLTYQRQPHHPKQEISLRLPAELVPFYRSLPARAKTAILERALGSYCQSHLFN